MQIFAVGTVNSGYFGTLEPGTVLIAGVSENVAGSGLTIHLHYRRQGWTPEMIRLALLDADENPSCIPLSLDELPCYESAADEPGGSWRDRPPLL